jgi:hypothetical protein
MTTTEPAQDTETAHRANLDPLTGEPGAHPIGTGFGAAAGGATGAALGSAFGPIGTALGAVVGAVAGGIAGSSVAEGFDPTAEDAYWSYNHHAQNFTGENDDYEDYAPAYRTGYSGFRDGKSFDDREADLRMEYEGGPQKAGSDASHDPNAAPIHRSSYPLPWDAASPAARAAYVRVAQARAAVTKRDAEEVWGTDE